MTSPRSGSVIFPALLQVFLCCIFPSVVLEKQNQIERYKDLPLKEISSKTKVCIQCTFSVLLMPNILSPTSTSVQAIVIYYSRLLISFSTVRQSSF